MRMNAGILKSNIAMKQGYLYIKRERHADRPTSRVFSKPWQRAYFILRREPYILEEYKDASLNVIRQIHIVSIIKHVGTVRTSKSKQYAFEVVLDGKDNKGSLQLACDNQILLDEWIKLFVSVMDKRKAQIGLIETYKGPHGIRDGYICNVEIVETILSAINDLHGEYVLVINNTRMSLLDPQNYSDVLSWPLNQITNYYIQRNLQRFILVMGKNCHFGSGKLIIESKDYAQVMTQLSNYMERKRLCNSLSSPERKPMNKQMRQSLPCKPRLSGRETTVETAFKVGTIFSNATNEESQKMRRLSNPEIGASNKVELRRLKSFPDSMNYESDRFKISIGKPSNSRLSENSKKNSLSSTKNASIEEGYILPNEIPENDRRRFERFSRERTSIIGRPLSTNESETSTSYLQLLDEDDQVPKLLETITNKLENPQRKPFANEKCSEKSRKVSTPVFTSNIYKKGDCRRSSEPVHKASIIERLSSRDSSSKLNQQFHSNSIEETSQCSKKQTSPRSSPKQQTVRSDGFPKQNSISVRTEAKGNLFSLAANHLINNRSPFQSTDTFLNGPLPNSIPFIQRKGGLNTSRPTSRDMEANVSVSVALDEPPPLPRRESPELLQWRQQQRSLIANVELNVEGRTRNSVVNDSDLINKNISSDNDEACELPPPPLPPKSRPIGLTKSFSSTINESVDEKEEMPENRRSSHSGETFKEKEPSIERQKSDEKPPVVPKRDYTIRSLVKQSRINGCDDSTSIAELSPKRSKRPSPLASKPPISKSLESLAFPREFLTYPVAEDEVDVPPSPSDRRSIISETDISEEASTLKEDAEISPSVSATTLSKSSLQQV